MEIEAALVVVQVVRSILIYSTEIFFREVIYEPLLLVTAACLAGCSNHCCLPSCGISSSTTCCCFRGCCCCFLYCCCVDSFAPFHLCWYQSRSIQRETCSIQWQLNLCACIQVSVRALRSVPEGHVLLACGTVLAGTSRVQ